MKQITGILSLVALLTFFSACEKDAGLLPKIAFKTGGNYISKDTTLAKNGTITIGIDAEKTESKDVLKKYNISKAVGSAAATTAFTKDLTGTEGDKFSHDFQVALENTAGVATKFTFTVTNRDGLVNQVSLTVTTK